MTSASLWVQGARPRTLGAAVAPVLVGTSAAVADADGVIWWRRAVLAMVVALALQVGRQLRQRLLRRCARHRQGAQGPGAPDRDRAGDARRGEAGRVPLVRRGRGRGPGALAGGQPVAAAGGRRRHRRRVALHRRAQAVRLPRPGRGDGARVLRVRGDGRFRVRAGRSTCPARRGGARSSSGCSRARSSSPTTCATSRPTRSPGSARSRFGSGRTAARRLFVACYVGSFLAVVAIGVTQPWALLGLLALPLAVAPVRTVLTRTDPPSLVSALVQTSQARSRRRGAGERRAVPVLSEHRLRIGDRAVTLLEGPAGWGECSPLPGLPERSPAVPAGCRRSCDRRLPARGARPRAGERAGRRALLGAGAPRATRR